MFTSLADGPINVLIPAYKAEKWIEACIDSVYNQTWTGKINIFVCIDGCKNTKEKVESILHRYKNVTALYCEENKGTYITLNTMLSVVKDGNILVFGADDLMFPEMIDEVMKTKKLGFVKAHGVLVAPIETIKRFGGFMPWRCAGDTELINRMKKNGVPCVAYPYMFFRRYHKDQITKSEKYGHGTEIRKQYIKIINKPRPKKIIPEINNYVLLERKKVSFNVATYPDREESFKKTIESVIDKFDVVRCCLNNYKKVPDWLSKLNVVAVIPKSDMKDKGKFIWSTERRNEIYFTGDDDLIYSDEYIEKHLKYLSCNNAIISSHGRILKKDAEKLQDCVKYGACLKDLEEDFQANVAGSGVMAFDLSRYIIDLDGIDCVGMADVGVAIYAAANNIPLIVRNHKSKELLYALDEDAETLWRDNLKKHGQQKDLINQIKRSEKITINVPDEFIVPKVFQCPERPRRKPFVPKIKSYVINLKDQPERIKQFKMDEEIATLRSDVVEPIKTDSFEVKTQHQKLIEMNAVSSEEIRAKEISNRLTFSIILKKCVEDKVIIFEDDNMFIDGFRIALNRVLYQLPEDFGICYLGCYAKREFKVDRFSNNLLEIKDGGAKIHGAHAIIYSKRVYKKISDALLSINSRITDLEIPRQCFSSERCFIADPLICFQRKYENTMHKNLDVDALQVKTNAIIKQSLKRSLKNEKNMA